ncbi:MAG: preprotein translocase subunit SecA, partial [bacterium]
PLIISGPAGTSYSDIYREFNTRVNSLVQKQTSLVNQKIAEAEQLLANAGENEDKIGELLLQAKRGAPKNKKLIKLMHEPGIKRLIDRVELTYMRDKKLHLLDSDLFFVIDEHEHTINLTEKGRKLLSPNNPELFVLPDITAEFSRIDAHSTLTLTEKLAQKERIQKTYSERSVMVHAISQLLKAYSLFERDVDYIVSDGKVIIVDEFTGRLMPGRRYSDGLHQALEAKEGVRIEHETQTFATITLQNYFRMYKKLAGMTGTAITEANEFYEIYKLEVVSIPTNKPVRRIDYDDQIYRTRREKYNAVIEEIEQLHKQNIPVLVGTTSVEASETLSRMLKRKGIPHSVLNAKHHQKEAEIVALAGQPGAVTIATNMAGRGTDIKLGKGVVKCDECLIKYDGNRELAPEEKKKARECIKNMPCGLHIIGTERHEARRIDLQLRGRAGRQGDPGASKFYLSLEDDLMRLFGSTRIASIMDRMGGLKEGEVIKHPLITRAIAQAQKRVEAQNFAIRKHLLEYDDVMNKQREVIYSRRQRILEGENLLDEYLYMIDDIVDKITQNVFIKGTIPEEWNWNIGVSDFRKYFSRTPLITDEEIKRIRNQDELFELFKREAIQAFEEKKARLGK